MNFFFLSNIFAGALGEELKKSVVYTAMLAIFILFWRLKGRKRRTLQDNGIASVAKIINVEKTLVESGFGVYARPVMKILLEIDEIGKRQITIKQSFDPSDLPETGEMVGILIDPNDPDKIMIYPEHQK
jgi:hypothetical protein